MYKQHEIFIMIKDMEDSEKRASLCIIDISEKRKNDSTIKGNYKEENSYKHFNFQIERSYYGPRTIL